MEFASDTCTNCRQTIPSGGENPPTCPFCRTPRAVVERRQRSPPPWRTEFSELENTYEWLRRLPPPFRWLVIVLWVICFLVVWNWG